MAALAVAAVAVINRDNSNEPLAVVVTPTPLPTATTGPTPDPTPLASDDKTSCATRTFGQHLSPLNPPADVHAYKAEPSMTIDTKKLYRAIITTSKGQIFICLDPALAPHSVNNFVTLARNNYYDGLKFHRVVKDFVIQGGDPDGTGNGGPGYKFNDEPVKGQYTLGAVAMANSGENSNGSQFFIATADDTQSLQPKYNLFGNVESGMSVAETIAQNDLMTSILVEEER
jgi:cyclophilin family peptidyl-prolyl cis-trans isomerase